MMTDCMKSLYIVKDGISEYVIVVPQNPSEVEEYAAHELQTWLHKATKAVLPIVKEGMEHGQGIYVGHTDFAAQNGVAGKEEENWHIMVSGHNLILTGGCSSEDRGIPYAVYHFLEDYVGIRWWNYAEEYIPVLSELKLNKQLKVEGTPLFRYRKLVASRAHTDFYISARNRINVVGSGDNVISGVFNSSVRKTGGAYYAGSPAHCHTLSLYFPVDRYFDSHPEWWGWDKQEQRRRSDRQYCLCNESLYQAMEEKLLENIRSEFYIAEKCGVPKPHFFSVSVSDDRLHCQCSNCVDSVKRSGRSGHYLKFVNRLARAAKKIYPDATLETLAYWDYLEPPIDDTVPESNLIIRFADMLVDVAHDVTYITNRKKLDMMKKWVNICKQTGTRLYTWEYMFHNFPNFPMPVMFQLPNNFRTYYEHGISGCFVQNEIWALSGFWSCNQWMLCKYMEDPYVDFDDTLNDFLTKYYGAASGAMRKYLELSYEIAQQSGLRIILAQTCVNWNYVTPEFVKEGLKLFEQAFAAVSGEKIYEQRLREAESSLYKCIAIMHDDLVLGMNNKGINFALPTVKEASEKVLECMDEIQEKYIFRYGISSIHLDKFMQNHIKNECELFQKLKERKQQELDIPDILQVASKDDVYQISAHQIVRYFGDQNLVTEVADESSASKTVLRFKASVYGFTDELVDDTAWSLPLVLTTDEKEDREILISKDELCREGYQWFVLKNVDNVCHGSNSRLYVYDPDGLVVQLSPIIEFFPFKVCDIYVSIKAEGHSFGNKMDQEDAIYFDRFVIVRRS